MNLINLTPHTCNLYTRNGIIEIPSTGSARVNTTETNVGAVTAPNGDTIEIRKTVYEDVVGLPEPVDGTMYIVSMVVAQRLSGQRNDLICPDTFKGAVRDDKGQIIGTRNFVIY